MEEFNTKEKLDALFSQAAAKAAGPYALVYSTFPTGMMMLGGAGAAMSESIDQKFGGYIVSVGSRGLVLKPLSKLRNTNGVSSPSKMKLANARTILLPFDQIVTVKNRPAGGILPGVRILTIVMENGRKYVWQVFRNEKALPWHAQGFEALMAFAAEHRKKKQRT